MAGPLLESKLHIPRRRPGLVARPRLSERLSRGAGSAMTLVSAPAGFGKTTLLTDWLATAPAEGRSAAWLSLDRHDNDPASYWTYLVAALDNALPGIGGGALSLLESPQPPFEAAISALLNDLHAGSHHVVLVLDDYHVIEASDVQDAMAFLLAHLPPHVHVVISSRADPDLPLARLRARGELVEIRAADLRFSADEAAAYLNGVMGLALTAQDVAALEGRTEGWIAALQLAALSMQGRDDIADFIAGFAGDDRFIVDYLAEEVLDRQPSDVRDFLLQTSVLERLSGPVCDAVTGHGGGKAMLERLERANLFLVPLDDRRRWYRYHQLFADLLQAHLLDEHPTTCPLLHRRASEWYEGNGDPSEAIRHALAAGDPERAADLAELAAPALRKSRQEAVMRGWLDTVPESVLRARPVLSVGIAGALLASGELEGVEDRLRDAERWLDVAAEPRQPASRSAQMVVVDQAEFPRLPSWIAIFRAGQALTRGDTDATVTHASRARELVLADDDLGRGAAAGLLGLAFWASGDLEAGRRSYVECMTSLQRAGHIADVLGCAIAVADIRIAQGRLREAMITYEQALRLAGAQGRPVLRGTADMYVGMSELHRERDDLDAASRQLLTAQELGEHTGLPQCRYRWRVAMARIREAQGDPDAALDLLDEAEHRYAGDFFPNVRPIPAQRARVWVVQGRLAEAFGWARERGLRADDELAYLREFEHVTLARALLARYQAERAEPCLLEVSGLLERLLRAAEAGDRTGSVIEILALQALASRLRGDVAAALEPLARALNLAEPGGYVRLFVDEFPRMSSLLEAAAGRGIAARYVERLLTAGGRTQHRTPVRQTMVDPLSERELDVLRLLATDLGGPEIARELVVSLNTVRTHTKRIYAKLGVNSRRAAVRRAEELELLSRRRG